MKTAILLDKFFLWIIFLITIFAIYLLYTFFGKEHKLQIKQTYISQIPSIFDMYTLNQLIHLKYKNPYAMLALLLDMVRKNNLEMKQNNDQLYFRAATTKEKITNSVESFFIDHFILEIFDREWFTIQSWAKKILQNKKKYGFLMTQWKMLVKQKLEKENLIVWNMKLAKALSIFLSVLYFLSIYFFFPGSIFKTVMILCFSLLLILFSFRFFRRTKQGQTEYLKWMAYKRYMQQHISELKHSNMEVLEKDLVHLICLMLVQEANQLAKQTILNSPIINFVRDHKQIQKEIIDIDACLSEFETKGR